MMAILYSSRDCPFAIRARMALAYAGIQCEIREADPAHIPQELAAVAPTATIPALHIADGEVLEQSMDILHWAVLASDPDGWMDFEVELLDEMNDLVHINDVSFNKDLELYRHSKSGDPHAHLQFRSECELFLQGLELRLRARRFLFDDRVCFADFALFPFVRQFSQVEQVWFHMSPYPGLRKWLAYHEGSALFHSVMNKYPVWIHGDAPVLFRQSIS